MRKKNREVTDRNEILEIMRQCDVCRLAMNDEGYPYILPLNFGMLERDGQVKLYFHGALEGTKYDIMEKDNRASFEMDCKHMLESDPERGYCTMYYESVIGRGRLYILSNEEKEEALAAICDHYHKDGFPFSPDAIPRTKVFKLVVEQMTGKRKN